MSPEIASRLTALRSAAEADRTATPFRFHDYAASVEQLRESLVVAARATIGAKPGGISDGSLVEAICAAVEGEVSQSELRLADELLEEATKLQWEIGTWASGPGEGRHSSHLVRSLQVARAHLLARGDTSAVEDARRLLDEADGDRNGLLEDLARQAAALRARLG